MTWVFFTFLAAFSQAWRNAFQSQLSGSLSVCGVTLARFLWAGPLAVLYVVGLEQTELGVIREFPFAFWQFCILAGVMQIVATGLMVMLFKQKNFAIGAGLAKCEAPVSAVLGIMFFGTTLSLYGWVGVIIGGIAVMMFSLSGGIRTISWKTAGIGLASSTAFALTSLWVREASLVLEGHFLLRASWVLLVVILFQTVILVGYMWLRERADLTLMLCRPKLVVLTSIASFLGSFGWFHAMSLKAVPYVKTLGQVEIFFMMIVSVVYLKAPIPKKDVFALMLVAIAAILVMWPQA